MAGSKTSWVLISYRYFRPPNYKEEKILVFGNFGKSRRAIGTQLCQ